jgi:hypothetical protein
VVFPFPTHRHTTPITAGIRVSVVSWSQSVTFVTRRLHPSCGRCWSTNVVNAWYVCLLAYTLTPPNAVFQAWLNENKISSSMIDYGPVSLILWSMASDFPRPLVSPTRPFGCSNHSRHLILSSCEQSDRRLALFQSFFSRCLNFTLSNSPSTARSRSLLLVSPAVLCHHFEPS